MESDRIVQGKGDQRRQQSNCQQWEEQARGADTGGQPRNNLIRARHASQRKKERKQERDWQQDHQDLWQLRQIKFNGAAEAKMVIEKDRDIFANIEDEPDR